MYSQLLLFHLTPTVFNKIKTVKCLSYIILTATPHPYFGLEFNMSFFPLAIRPRKEGTVKYKTRTQLKRK